MKRRRRAILPAAHPMTRAIFRVRLARGLERIKGTWVVVRPDGVLVFWSYKTEAIEHGRILARAEWEKGRPAQLVVHNRDGQIAFEHNYGHDPKRTPS